MRQLFRELVVARERAMDQHDRMVTHAWLSAMLHRQPKKLPALKTLLARREAQPQSTGQMRTMLHVLSAQYGLPMRKAKGKKAAAKHRRRHG